jgi:hypothetical protein
MKRSEAKNYPLEMSIRQNNKWLVFAYKDIMYLKTSGNYTAPLGYTQKFAVITGYPFFWGHTIKKK